MNEQKIMEVFSDEQFALSLLELETPEELLNAFASKQVDLTIEESTALKKLLTTIKDSELSDNELENVAGGSYYLAIPPNISILIKYQYQNMLKC